MLRKSIAMFFVAIANAHIAAVAAVPGDAICKTDPIPAGWIPVEEMQSAECAAKSPFEMNAWILDRVSESVVACIRPNYGNAWPPLVGYVVCGRVPSNKCPLNKDGTANAFRLASPGRCPGDEQRIGCTWAREGIANTPLAAKHERSVEWVLSGAADSTCPEGPNGERPIRGIVGPIIDERPLCVDHNPAVLTSHLELDDLTSQDPQYRGDLLLVSRMFFDPRCGDDQSTVNAVVVKRVPHSAYWNRRVYHCGTSREPDGDVTGWTGGNFFDYKRSIESYHDERCGLDGDGPRKLNAMRLFIRESDRD